MSEFDRNILIVDDSEIDRKSLKNIISAKFNAFEAANGYEALELVLKKSLIIDAILLDIQMPILDGFAFLEILEKNNYDAIPVLLVTSEATKQNIEKSVKYGNVEAFLRKPFTPSVILGRLSSIFKRAKYDREQFPKTNILTLNDIEETHKYIAKLKSIYSLYLENTGLNDEPYSRVSNTVRIFLTEYVASENLDIDKDHIELISYAAYFYDIGKMVLSNAVSSGLSSSKNDKKIFEAHTLSGSKIINLNTAPECDFFVKYCSDICLHHHERWDGKGYPHNLKEDKNSISAQFCSIAIKLDEAFSEGNNFTKENFDSTLNKLKKDTGLINPALYKTIENCKNSIIEFYESSIAEISN